MTRGRCWYCGTHCNPFHDFCIDHVVPLSRGGDDEVGNLVPCCAACNANKGVLVVEEWRSWFDRADELDEWPWTRPDRRFWFEGGDLDGPHRAGDLDPAFIRDLRNDEVRAWRRTHGDTR